MRESAVYPRRGCLNEGRCCVGRQQRSQLSWHRSLARFSPHDGRSEQHEATDILQVQAIITASTGRHYRCRSPAPQEGRTTTQEICMKE